MAFVNINNVTVLDNPSSFTNPFQFEIVFECLQELSDDLEWKVIYVGNPEDSAYDQTLEEVMVGPVPVGFNRFVLQAAAPSHDQIRNEDLIGVTVVLVTCSFLDQEFVRIGYYVSNEYSEPYDPETPPNPVEISKLYRNILAAEPRVTRFPIDWTGQGLPVEGGPTEGEVEVDKGEDMLDEDEEDDEEDDDEDDDNENMEDDIDLEDCESEVDEGMNFVICNDDSMDVFAMQNVNSNGIMHITNSNSLL